MAGPPLAVVFVPAITSGHLHNPRDIRSAPDALIGVQPATNYFSSHRTHEHVSGQRTESFIAPFNNRHNKI